MPAASSIYWNSQDSQKSSGDGSSSSSSGGGGGGGRSYIDPWDLENYAYLRRQRNLIASSRNENHRPTQQQQHNMSPQNIESSTDSYYWYPVPAAALMRDQPGFTSIDELYHGPSRRNMHLANLQYPMQQATYEEDARYVTPNPVYVPLSDLEHPEDTVEHPWPKLQPRRRNRPIKNMAYHKDECPCPYHGPLPDTPGAKEAGVTPPKQLGLNTYGHLRIDYAKSWNSLHRKMKN